MGFDGTRGSSNAEEGRSVGGRIKANLYGTKDRAMLRKVDRSPGESRQICTMQTVDANRQPPFFIKYNERRTNLGDEADQRPELSYNLVLLLSTCGTLSVCRDLEIKLAIPGSSLRGLADYGQV